MGEEEAHAQKKQCTGISSLIDFILYMHSKKKREAVLSKPLLQTRIDIRKKKNGCVQVLLYMYNYTMDVNLL